MSHSGVSRLLQWTQFAGSEPGIFKIGPIQGRLGEVRYRGSEDENGIVYTTTHFYVLL